MTKTFCLANCIIQLYHSLWRRINFLLRTKKFLPRGLSFLYLETSFCPYKFSFCLLPFSFLYLVQVFVRQSSLFYISKTLFVLPEHFLMCKKGVVFAVSGSFFNCYFSFLSDTTNQYYRVVIKLKNFLPKIHFSFSIFEFTQQKLRAKTSSSFYDESVVKMTRKSEFLTIQK